MITLEVHPDQGQKIFSVDTIFAEMIKQIEGQVRDLQKKLAETPKVCNLLRLQPCKGDQEIRQKDEEINRLGKTVNSLIQHISELEKKRREMMSEAMKKPGCDSPRS